MNTKLIMVEGILGSGKTTFAKKIADYYKEKSINVKLFNEGDYHPADLSWQVCLTDEILAEIIEKYPALEPQMKDLIRIEEEDRILPFAKIKTEDYGFYKEMETYEIYDKKVPPEVFMETHVKRWNRFGKNAKKEDDLNIFECAFFQNHVNQLLNIYMMDTEEMKAYLGRLADAVKDLNPVIIYLSQSDVAQTIKRAAEQRVFPHGKWIDDVIAYTESTPYAVKNNLKGFDGLIHIIQQRKLTELAIMGDLGVKTIIIEDDYHWDLQWEMIRHGLEKLV